VAEQVIKSPLLTKRLSSPVQVFLLQASRRFKIIDAMFSSPPPIQKIIRAITAALSNYVSSMRLLLQLLPVGALLLSLSTPVFAQSCPDLRPWMPGAEPDWFLLEAQLSELMPQCLNSTEYFALLGAAQLNTGKIAEALEALERSLLLNPANGGAQVDYAEALYVQGQLFSALDLNRQLLARDDLPEHLQPLLQQRQQSWRARTRQHGFQLDALAGYDNNLNGAPEPGQITLTLSGEPVVLPLNPEYRPQSGAYLNMKLTGRYRQLAPQHQHNVQVDLSGRSSDHRESDLLQLDTRYVFIKPGKSHSWQAGATVSHLQFGGSPLYTASEVSMRYTPASSSVCQSSVGAAMQYQFFHNQSRLNAVESKLGGSLNCPLGKSGTQQLVSELSVLGSSSINAQRPGGDRLGWQFNMLWQMQLPRGVLSSQLNHTELKDDKSYSPLLANGAERNLSRSYVLLQYRQPLFSDTALLINLYHQKQRSNIELFRSTDSTAEIGVSHSF